MKPKTKKERFHHNYHDKFFIYICLIFLSSMFLFFDKFMFEEKKVPTVTTPNALHGVYIFFFPHKSLCYNFLTPQPLITSMEQLAIYATFEHKGKICEHFNGFLPLSQMFLTTISAENIMKVLVEYFERIKVSISNTTNVNLVEKKGLKRLLQHEVPLLVWIGCGNQLVSER